MPTNFKHCKRYNVAGDAHELTFSCFRRRPFLGCEHARHWLVDAIKLARRKHALHVWAYVIMPEHAHLLIWPTKSAYSISGVLATIKQSVTRKALNHVQQNAPKFLARMEDRQPNGDCHYRF